MKMRKMIKQCFLLSAVIIMVLFIPALNHRVYAAGSAAGYKWIRVKTNWLKIPNGDFTNCDSIINDKGSYEDDNHTCVFKLHYYQKWSSSADNLADLYCECKWPPSTIDPGSTVSLPVSLHADVTWNRNNSALLMSGKVFIAAPDLDLKATESIKNAVYFRNKSSDNIFYIGNTPGFARQDYVISAVMPKNNKEGDRVSIYFRTTAGLQEWQYQLMKFDDPGKPSTGSGIKAGTVLKGSTASYKVLAGLKTVSYVAPIRKTNQTVTVPATVKFKNKTYKVTVIASNAFNNNTRLTKVTIGKNVSNIGAKAFYNCKQLKTIKISSSKLTKTGANAFRNIYSKAIFTVPKVKLKAYSALLKKSGVPKTAKIK